MPDKGPGYNPTEGLTEDDKSAIGTAEAILAEGAKELEGAKEISPGEDIGIAEDDVDEFAAGLDNMFSEGGNQ